MSAAGMWTWLREGVSKPVGMPSRERGLLDAAEAAVSMWEICRDDVEHDARSLRHEDALVRALERLDGALDPYHLPSDGGE
jgi:hypothetical protein